MNKGSAVSDMGALPWRFLQCEEIDRFVRSLLTAYEVVGVRRKKGRFTLDRIDDPAVLELDFPPRIHSAKKFLFPNWDKLFHFQIAGQVLLEPEKAAQPRVIFGMHPCDIHAVKVLDDCLFEGESDSAYRAKREATLIVGVDCVPDDHCFCASMGTDKVTSGFDLFLHKVDDGYLLQCGSDQGWDLVTHHAPEIVDKEMETPLALQDKPCVKTLHFPADTLATLLHDCYDHPIWTRVGEQCLGCGACSLVCPTCYCFNVQDDLELNLESGVRVRTWDSCQFDTFTSVAGGNDFRKNQTDRQRHRFYRKYKYLWDQHKRTACVGCGRCVRECLSHIDVADVLNELKQDLALPDPPQTPGMEYLPQTAEIVAVEELTPLDKLFRLRLPQVLDFSPGTFLEVSVFGLGEAPFTIASAPDGSHYVEIVVRAAGNLTRALHRLTEGDSIGVRGPFGSGFPLDEFRGRDVILVAGGMGLITLRSLLLTILSRRDEFGRVLLLYGARNPGALLFLNDLRLWHTEGDLDSRFVIQETDSLWSGTIGDITALFRDLAVAADRTTVAVSGPAGMYRFTNPILFRLGIAEDKLFLNLERHMKCGLGKCGRCQINDIRVCECGPIFPYSRVRHLREAIER